MQTHNIHAAKTHLSRLVEEAAAGEVIIIAKNGKPIAKLVALEEAVKLPRIGFAKGMGTGQPFDYEAFQAADADIEALFLGGKA